MKRKKPPVSGPPEGFRPVSGAPPPGWSEMWDSWSPPEPDDPAPAHDAIDLASAAAGQERRAWASGHIAWLNANGLAWTPDELDRWYDHPDRDRVPMPGVLEWQRRISQHYSGWRANVMGVQSGYRDAAPALDAAAAHEVLALRRAREADAERLAWFENALTQARTALSGSAAREAELTGRLARQDETIQEQAGRIQGQAADIAKHKAGTAELDRTIGQRDAEIRRLEAETARLNAAVTDEEADAVRLRAAVSALESETRGRDALARRKDDRIRELEAAVRHEQRAQDAEPLAGQHELTAGQEAARVRGLEDENRYLRERGTQLEGENERLRGRLARRAAAGGARHS